MQIAFQALSAQLKKQLSPLYILVGQDQYLANEALSQIKQAWQVGNDCDEQSITILRNEDWQEFKQSYQHYNLFSNKQFISLRYDKKSLDNTAKQAIEQYIKNPLEHCITVLCLNQIAPKQIATLSQHAHVVVIQVAPFNATQVLQWIKSKLDQLNFKYNSEVPALIQRQTQGNMLACAQAIEKIALSYENKEILTTEKVSSQLIDQAEFQLYEWIDHCLNGNLEQALYLLDRLLYHRADPILMLWLIGQEIRQLIQLHHLLNQPMPFNQACIKQGIWSTKIPLYRLAVQRLPLNDLYRLLQQARQIDEWLKSGHNSIEREIKQLTYFFVRRAGEKVA